MSNYYFNLKSSRYTLPSTLETAVLDGSISIPCSVNDFYFV